MANHPEYAVNLPYLVGFDLGLAFANGEPKITMSPTIMAPGKSPDKLPTFVISEEAALRLVQGLSQKVEQSRSRKTSPPRAH